MKENIITIVSSDYPSKGYPKNIFVQQLVHAMIEQGVIVNVVAPQSIVHALFHGEKLLPRHSKGTTNNGVEYDIYRPYALSFGNNNPFKRLTKWFNRLSVETQLRKISTDILYCHFWSSALLTYEYAISNDIPLFVACGEGDDAIENMIATISRVELQRLAKAVNGVVSVSSENMRKCIMFGLCSSMNVDVFPNCVDTDLFHKYDVTDMRTKLGIEEDDFVISFVGGFIPRKGPDRVAQAVKKLNDPKIKVIFIGKPFKGYAYDFDCPGIIHKGMLEHEFIPLYLNCSDVFVMPTRKEGCCNAIVEALAMGIPVVSSNLSFNDDILDKKNSIRVDPDNIDAIANAIRTLRDDVVLRRSMSAYSLSRHDAYTIHGRAKRILEFMNCIIRSK